MKSRRLIVLSLELHAFKLLDEDFASKKLRSGEKMPAKNPPLGITKGDVCMHKWFPFPETHITLKTKYFHSPREFDRIVFAFLLIVKSNHGMRRSSYGGKAAQLYVLIDGNFCQTLVEICSVRKLPDKCSLDPWGRHPDLGIVNLSAVLCFHLRSAICRRSWSETEFGLRSRGVFFPDAEVFVGERGDLASSRRSL